MTSVPLVSVAVDHEVRADAVHGRRAERADQTERDEEDPAVHRRRDADVADTTSPPVEHRRSRRAIDRTA